MIFQNIGDFMIKTDNFNAKQRIPLVAILFSSLVASADWLSSYRSIREGISLADLFFAIIIIYFFLEYVINRRKVRILYVFPILLLTYLLMSSLVNASLLTDFSVVPVITRYAKFAFFWFIIIFLIPRYFSNVIFFKALQSVAWIAALGLIFQYIIYYSFGTYFDLKIPFLAYANDTIESIDFALIRAVEFRPDSIFLEPAHLAVFLSYYLSYLLFAYDKRKYKYLSAVSISIIMIMTTSSTALFLLVIIWVFHYIQIIFESKSADKPIKAIAIGVFVIAVSLPIFINTPQLYQAFERVQDISGIAVTGRILAGNELVSSLSGVHNLIGIGFGNFQVYEYLNGVNYLIYTSGYIGVILYAILIIIPFKNTNYLGKISLLTFVVLSFSRPNVISISIIITSALVYFGYIEKRAKNTELV